MVIFHWEANAEETTSKKLSSLPCAGIVVKGTYILTISLDRVFPFFKKLLNTNVVEYLAVHWTTFAKGFKDEAFHNDWVLNFLISIFLIFIFYLITLSCNWSNFRNKGGCEQEGMSLSTMATCLLHPARNNRWSLADGMVLIDKDLVPVH